jgi:hypothetical protein
MVRSRSVLSLAGFAVAVVMFSLRHEKLALIASTPAVAGIVATPGLACCISPGFRPRPRLFAFAILNAVWLELDPERRKDAR